MSAVVSAATEAPSDEALAVGMRFARIYELMRSDGRFNLDLFLRSFENGVASGCVIRTPSRRENEKTKGVPEVRYLPAETEVTTSMRC